MQTLQEALLDAFRSHNELKRMLRFGLDMNLDAVAGNGPLSTVVFDLVNWAESQGRIDELFDAARKENPGNPKLTALFNSWQSSGNISSTTNSAPADVTMPKKPAPMTVIKLPGDLLFKVHETAVKLGLANSRNTLLGGLDPSVSAQIPTTASPLEQLLRDLQVLNTIGRLRDGSIPLIQWLDSALRLTSLRPESEIFETARQMLSR